jgi:hypothetical protein
MYRALISVPHVPSRPGAYLARWTYVVGKNEDPGATQNFNDLSNGCCNSNHRNRWRIMNFTSP